MRPLGRSDSVSRLIQGLFFGGAGALLIGCAIGLHWTDGLERGAQNALFRRPRQPSGRVVVLRIDDDTVARFRTWPLPRGVYGQIIDRLVASGVRTIAFDILFPVPTQPTPDDRMLERASARAGRVVHAISFEGAQSPASANRSTPAPAIPLMQSRFRIDDEGADCRTTHAQTLSGLGLQSCSKALGYVDVYQETDGSLRRIPQVIRYGGALYPSLALAAAAAYLGLSSPQIEARPDKIVLPAPMGQRREIPIDSNGEAWVNWVSVGTIPSYSANALLDGLIDPAALKDRLVVIGATATGAFEHHATPLSAIQPAVELQANGADDIISNRPLHEIPEWFHWMLVLCFPLLTGALVARRSSKVTALIFIGISAVLWLVAIYLMAVVNIYVPVAAPQLAALLTCVIAIGHRQVTDAQGLKVAEERYSLAARGANDGIWDWNLVSGEVYYSPRWKAMLGYEETEIGSTSEEWFSRIHPDDRDLVQRLLAAHLNGDSPHFEIEVRMLHKDGDPRWMLVRGLKVLGADGKPSRIAGSQSDISLRKDAEAKLIRNAIFDSLTGLPNRALFMDRLARALERSRRRSDYLFAVLFMDLDRFKVINDSLGHVTGDEMLQAVGKRMQSCLRPGDTAARLGGDEFTMLLDDISDISDATRIAERLQTQLAMPLLLGGHEIFPTASIGIAVSAPHYDGPEALLRDADTAMYRAKAIGIARHEVFDEAMHAHSLALLRLETDLRRAIDHHQFRVFYQPIVALDTGRLAGFEALVRWDHPERGLVPPSVFIPLAEETGMIIAIDRWVLREACRQTAQWNAGLTHLPPLSISVNLSSKQFAQRDLVDNARQALADSGLRPEWLKLEVTEGVMMDNPDSAAKLLLELKTLGVRLSIDDFGTGYSSLSYLHRFSLDTLKIDQSFVGRIGEHGENSEIVITIISLAHNLKMDVVAEGVATPHQLARLRAEGCDYGQGYLFARPMPSEDAEAMIAQNPHW